MCIKNKLDFKSFCIISGIAVCFSLITAGCNQLNRYGMNSSKNREDLRQYKVEFNPGPIDTSEYGTLLHFSAYYGNREQVRYLIENQSVKVNEKNKLHIAPIHYAVSEGHIEVTKLLIEKGANIHIKDRYGCTPLRLSVINKHNEIQELLIQAQLD